MKQLITLTAFGFANLLLGTHCSNIEEDTDSDFEMITDDVKTNLEKIFNRRLKMSDTNDYVMVDYSDETNSDDIPIKETHLDENLRITDFALNYVSNPNLFNFLSEFIKIKKNKNFGKRVTNEFLDTMRNAIVIRLRNVFEKDLLELKTNNGDWESFLIDILKENTNNKGVDKPSRLVTTYMLCLVLNTDWLENFNKIKINILCRQNEFILGKLGEKTFGNLTHPTLGAMGILMRALKNDICVRLMDFKAFDKESEGPVKKVKPLNPYESLIDKLILEFWNVFFKN